MKKITNIREIETVFSETGEMIIDKNRNNNVLSMSMKKYEESMFDDETIKCLLKSEKDIEEGKTRKAAEVIREFEEKYGF